MNTSVFASVVAQSEVEVAVITGLLKDRAIENIKALYLDIKLYFETHLPALVEKESEKAKFLLLRNFYKRRAPALSRLFEEGNRNNALIMLQAGVVDLVKARGQGQRGEVLVGRVEIPGSFLNILPLFSSQKANAYSAVTRAETSLILLSTKNLVKLPINWYNYFSAMARRGQQQEILRMQRFDKALEFI
jgi:hypothetical protein